MKKALIVGAVILLLLPILPRLIPEPFSPERLQEALKGAGLDVSEVAAAPQPGLGAVEQISMKINGEHGELYKFDDEGKIVTQLEYQKPDSGSVIVESWNLSEQLGAAKPKNKPISADRNGMYMFTITSEDKALRERAMKVFKSL